MARASGCSLGFSSAYTRERSSPSATPGCGSTSVTCGAPLVMVPVLSKTTVRTACADSSASADFTRMPLAAPRPVPTMIAVGVAKPSAHGHEITRTEIAYESAVANSAPTNIHTTNATRAMPITTGTNTPLILSAIFSIGAFELVASSTSCTMPASTVSAPTRSARMVNQPAVFTVAPVTAAPSRLETGSGSPVITDSSTEPSPSSTTPSTGTASPVRTTSTSPTRTSFAGTFCSTPFSRRVAILGARSISCESESVVLPFARASRNFPNVMSVRIMPALSK